MWRHARGRRRRARRSARPKSAPPRLPPPREAGRARWGSSAWPCRTVVVVQQGRGWAAVGSEGRWVAPPLHRLPPRRPQGVVVLGQPHKPAVHRRCNGSAAARCSGPPSPAHLTSEQVRAGVHPPTPRALHGPNAGRLAKPCAGLEGGLHNLGRRRARVAGTRPSMRPPPACCCALQLVLSAVWPRCTCQ